MCITCGSIRKHSNSPENLHANRDLQTRKEMREKAWEVDQWASTVSKTGRAFETHF